MTEGTSRCHAPTTRNCRTAVHTWSSAHLPGAGANMFDVGRPGVASACAADAGTLALPTANARNVHHC